MKTTLKIVYTLLTPVFPLVMAIREYRYIKLKMKGINVTFFRVLICHFQAHFEMIREWNDIWEKEINTPQ